MSISNFLPIQNEWNYDLKLDTCKLACPLPLLKTKQALYGLQPGQVLWVVSCQPSLVLDIKTLLKQTGDKLLQENHSDEIFHFVILRE